MKEKMANNFEGYDKTAVVGRVSKHLKTETPV